MSPKHIMCTLGKSRSNSTGLSGSLSIQASGSQADFRKSSKTFFRCTIIIFFWPASIRAICAWLSETVNHHDVSHLHVCSLGQRRPSRKQCIKMMLSFAEDGKELSCSSVQSCSVP